LTLETIKRILTPPFCVDSTSINWRDGAAIAGPTMLVTYCSSVIHRCPSTLCSSEVRVSDTSSSRSSTVTFPTLPMPTKLTASQMSQSVLQISEFHAPTAMPIICERISRGFNSQHRSAAAKPEKKYIFCQESLKLQYTVRDPLRINSVRLAPACKSGTLALEVWRLPHCASCIQTT